MKNQIFVIFGSITLCGLIFISADSFAEDKTTERLPPKRLASIGDSITVAVDAELYGENPWASWANGYHGFWQWLFGLSNVNSHNQRITHELRIRRGRKNFMEAESGADSFDLPGQAAQAVAHAATYVPWLMGHNDICQHDESQIPDESAFEGNARDALSNLSAGLPAGATIYVLGMADIIRLYEIAQDKKALGIVDCEFLWFFTLFDLFPCGTVLGPLRTDADRERMHERIAGGSDFEGFNPILRRLVDEFNRTDPQHYYYYTDAVFEYLYSESEISDLDCFHPSPEGQRALSKISWNDVDGPQF